MGLLDDAIREHLELKRLRGADPGLVSREESEVFGRVRGEGPEADDDEIATPGPPAHEDAPLTGQPAKQSESFSNTGQETVELDMQTMLEGESGQKATPAGPAATEPVAARPPSSDIIREPDATDDSLEWEMPGDAATEESGDEPVADVLEETPDFLRDTPEQERLWFEQRPPRDFDFDK